MTNLLNFIRKIHFISYSTR